MGWSTYIDAVRLDARTWYYLQRVDDDLGADHPVLRSPSGVLLHPSEASARRAAEALREPIEAKSPFIVDLDAALAWAGAPIAAPLTCEVLMMGWHVLVDLGALKSPVDLDADRESPLEEAFHKLHVGTAYADKPTSAPEPPTWTSEELALVAATLEDGIHRLRLQLLSGAEPDSAAAV